MNIPQVVRHHAASKCCQDAMLQDMEIPNLRHYPKIYLYVYIYIYIYPEGDIAADKFEASTGKSMLMSSHRCGTPCRHARISRTAANSCPVGGPNFGPCIVHGLHDDILNLQAVRTHIHVCIYIYMHMHMHILYYIYIFICMYKCMHMYTYIYIYIYVLSIYILFNIMQARVRCWPVHRWRCSETLLSPSKLSSLARKRSRHINYSHEPVQSQNNSAEAVQQKQSACCTTYSPQHQHLEDTHPRTSSLCVGKRVVARLRVRGKNDPLP